MVLCNFLTLVQFKNFNLSSLVLAVKSVVEYQMLFLQRSLINFTGYRLHSSLIGFCGRDFSNQILKVMSKTALIILAPGAEEMEFVISADVLRRAGVKVTVAGLCGSEAVKCSRDVVIVPDTSLEASKSNKYDVVILPGGLGGSKAMAESSIVGEVLKQQESEGRIIAAICAAPTALAAHDICKGKSLTSYPSVKAQLENLYKYVDDQPVVHDGILITSRGPGTAFDFGLKVSEVLVGSDKAAEVAKGMLLK